MTVRCPKCGHRFKPFKEYRGHLEPYLPIILDGLKRGQFIGEIAERIEIMRSKERDPFMVPYYGLNPSIRYIAKRYGIEIKEDLSKKEKNINARNEAIFLASKLGGGNTTYAELGRLYNRSRDRIRQIACAEYRKRRQA